MCEVFFIFFFFFTLNRRSDEIFGSKLARFVDQKVYVVIANISTQ